MSFYKCIQAYGRKDLNISTPSLISACFFTVGIQAQPLIFKIYSMYNKDALQY